jgi:glyoxylase-like metal-dependent hydrolase (beta-lactamase superfamily II)
VTPRIQSFFDAESSTFSYVVYDADGGTCAIIDPVLAYDPASGRTSSSGVELLMAFVRHKSLAVAWILETHAHADHISAAAHVRSRLGGKIGISAHIREVQLIFSRVFNFEREFLPNGSQFDHLFNDAERFKIGTIEVEAIHVPGHTPADMAYKVGDEAVFVGDTIFMPDVGTARCDFPGGNAETMYDSIQKLLSLPPATELYLCHDYPPEGRQPAFRCSVGSQVAQNIHVRAGIDKQTFVKLRSARDETLDPPKLMIPSIQVNIRAGNFPPAEENGMSYLKVPIYSQ